MWRLLSLPALAAATKPSPAAGSNPLMRLLLGFDALLEMLAGRGTVSVMAVAESVD